MVLLQSYVSVNQVVARNNIIIFGDVSFVLYQVYAVATVRLCRTIDVIRTPSAQFLRLCACRMYKTVYVCFCICIWVLVSLSLLTSRHTQAHTFIRKIGCAHKHIETSTSLFGTHARFTLKNSIQQWVAWHSVCRWRLVYEIKLSKNKKRKKNTKTPTHNQYLLFIIFVLSCMWHLFSIVDWIYQSLLCIIFFFGANSRRHIIDGGVLCYDTFKHRYFV